LVRKHWLQISSTIAALLLGIPVVPSAADANAAREAEKELFAARYEHAAELYSRLVHDDPGFAAGYYGLVRAHISGYRAHRCLCRGRRGPSPRADTADAQCAAAMAAWRRGDVLDAERLFKKGYKLNPNFAGAFYGLASVYSSISNSSQHMRWWRRRIGSHPTIRK